MSQTPSRLDIPEKFLTEREVLIRGAAECLKQFDNANVIASGSTAQFVSETRHIFRANGFNFTDSDIRDIHELLRELIVRDALAKAGHKPVYH